MLSAEQFPDFIAEVHDGREPFPWQVALLNRLVTEGHWPDVIDVPTGLGKTSVLDVAVFAASLGVPCARRRVFYVVDRRLVVDEAHEHATTLSEALQRPGGRPVTAEVAARLALPGDEVTLDVTRMRGGATWDRTWLERPDRYAVITGTIDQVGSRLLFRGYGVSEHARPIDAALVGADSLIIVDEAHLSQAFTTTVTTALGLDSASITPRPVLVTMSATTAAGHLDVHRITAADHRHPVAGRRLYASKRLSLVEVKTTKTTADTAVPAALAGVAASLARHDAVGLVGVVVNTVARARAVFDLVRQDHDAVLLTGRSRPADREYLLDRYYPRLRVNRDRAPDKPFIVVATQTVEVGANIDVDALVTDSAPWASLVQRLGRLNRLGRSRRTPAPAIVVHDTTVTTDDPVYGAARLATWTWLADQATPHRYTARLDPLDGIEQGLDVSPANLRLLNESATDELQVDDPYVPVLHRATLDAWTRTAPAPVPDQPIEPFLHGLRATPPPVTIIWRANLDGPPERWITHLDQVPPVTEEGIEVSVHAARQWLAGKTTTADDSDLDGVTTLNTSAEPGPAGPRVLRYRRRGDAEPVRPSQIRPGDTIIVPTTFGGCDQYGWHPTSTEPVIDVADLAYRRGRPILRLGPTLPTAVKAWDPAAAPTFAALLTRAGVDVDNGSAQPHTRPYRLLLGAIRQHQHDRPSSEPGPAPLLNLLDALLDGALQVTITASDEDDTAPYAGLLTVRTAGLADDDTVLGSSTRSGARISLEDHQRAVADRAAQFGHHLGLPDKVLASVIAAARWHDEGKRDPRFQLMLWEGDTAAADLAEEDLAKSGMDPTDRAAFTRARKTAGYPDGMRHEALSARIAARRLATDDTIDPDLVHHLIASHHGRARPLLPPVTDPSPVTINLDDLGVIDTAATLDWEHPRRFADLNNTYGRWGLALLETVVRLADIWCSARDETLEGTP
ncbi:type I-U CRISPR-associated helicase/endonuclease Cas3 [Dactylosporangium sp. NPDC000555]|uniref:type I-G CRISPR-associated helicase/endonuclease Cas3g n=1 Tax=Dactylosporangium sp. NPDC000555 TaxID=3154260 RepID=UPI003333CBDA